MENELQILNNIEKNKNATQRDIAYSTGMSLGSVNILIKRLVKKGLVKIEKLNTRNIRYILTPQGMKEQAEATYNYIRLSYRYIEDINRKIDLLLSEEKYKAMHHVVLFGHKDEICEMLENRLNQVSKPYIHLKSISQIDDSYINFIEAMKKEKYYFVVWHPDYREMLIESPIEFIYLLDII